MKFAVQKENGHSRDATPILWNCSRYPDEFQYRVFQRPQDVPAEYVPVGSVEWVEKILGHSPHPDYFPAFLRPWLHRKVWESDVWPRNCPPVFVKPSDRHKRFTGFVTRGGPSWKGKRKPPFWLSEVMDFVTEWRYYVARGRVYAAEYCCGDEAEMEAPPLEIDWGQHSGAVDFGRLRDGRIALIENNCPYACGWYGDLQSRAYLEWLAAAWQDVSGKEIYSVESK